MNDISHKSALDLPLAVSTFRDFAASTKGQESVSLRDLAERVRTTTAASKAELPWLKLATFGDHRSAKGSLRHNANVLRITGIECDYDGEIIDIDLAGAWLRAAGIAALVYTSPSHTGPTPRWRVLCPTSKPLPPEQRAALVARVNGAIGGDLSVESFTLSQAFYYGAVGSNPAHEVALIDGRFIDQADDLDAGAVYPVRDPATRIDVPALAPGQPPDTHARAALAAAVAAFDDPFADGQRHHVLRAATLIVAPFILSGHLEESDVVDALETAMTNSGREPNEGETESLLNGALRMAKPYEPPTGGIEFGSGEPAPADAQPRPTIRIKPGELPRHIAEAESALIAANLGLYERAGAVVRVGPVVERDRHGVVRQVQRIIEVSEAHLLDLMARAAWWEKYDARSRAYVPASCPVDVARGYLARKGLDRNLPVLNGVIFTPTLRADGSILDRPGYDVASGLLFDPRGESFPAVDAEPTRDDAAHALADLRALFDEFPFRHDASRAVALAAVLTALIRPSLPTAPLHAVTATEFGSGKSYLTDIVATIATGGTVAPLACGATDEEFEKRLAGALIAGDSFIVIDNVDREVNGPLLNQTVTQERVRPRRLGKSENVEVVNSAFLMMNGNNIPIPADMARRVLLCSMDAGVERPELRRFASDPLSMAKANRGRYVRAALTILRAYCTAGRPTATAPLGSFEAWSRLVRAALLWLGEADPASTMDAVRAADPKRLQLLAMMSQWGEVIADRRVTVREVIDAAVTAAGGEFREAALAVAGERGAIDGRRLGRWLSANKGRVVGGMRFEAGSLRHGNQTWLLHGSRAAGETASVHHLYQSAGDEFAAGGVG